MFNFHGGEILIILLLALVVLGPEKLPEAMRKAGSFYAELKKMSSGFQEEFRKAVDEPNAELRKTAEMIRESADFRNLTSGARPEKPKSAEMADAMHAIQSEEPPSEATPSFNTTDRPDNDQNRDGAGAEAIFSTAEHQLDLVGEIDDKLFPGPDGSKDRPRAADGETDEVNPDE